jgi:hypothetical protein
MNRRDFLDRLAELAGSASSTKTSACPRRRDHPVALNRFRPHPEERLKGASRRMVTSTSLA